MSTNWGKNLDRLSFSKSCSSLYKTLFKVVLIGDPYKKYTLNVTVPSEPFSSSSQIVTAKLEILRLQW